MLKFNDAVNKLLIKINLKVGNEDKSKISQNIYLNI
jgi:hypothetical protein